MKWRHESEKGKLIAYWQDLAGYYRDENGVVWSFSGRSFVNQGELTNDQLKERFRITVFV